MKSRPYNLTGRTGPWPSRCRGPKGLKRGRESSFSHKLWRQRRGTDPGSCRLFSPNPNFFRGHPSPILPGILPQHKGQGLAPGPPGCRGRSTCATPLRKVTLPDILRTPILARTEAPAQKPEHQLEPCL